MVVNRYNKPAEAPVLNTYVPINFAELYKIGMANKEAVELAAKDFSTTLDKFGEFQSLSDIDVQNYYNNSIAKYTDLINEAAANPDVLKDSAWRSKLRLRGNSIDRALLSRLREGAKQLETRSKVTAEMKAKGLYNENWDVYRDQAGNWRQYDASNYDTLREGILSDVSPILYQSLRDVIDPYIKGLKPTFIGGNVNPNTGERVPFTKGFNAITEQHLSDILSRSVNEIMRTPQGQMWYRDIASAVKSANPEATNQDIYNAFMANMMLDARYKLVADPVEDEYAMRASLLSLENQYKAERERAKLNAQGSILGIEDMMAKNWSEKLKFMNAASREASPEFAQKYDSTYSALSTQMATLAGEALLNDPVYAQAYQTIRDRLAAIAQRSGAQVTDDEISNEAAMQAFNAKGVNSRYKEAFDKINTTASTTRSNEMDESVGRRLQDIYNNTLQAHLNEENKNPNANPFTLFKVDSSDGMLYYGESKVHQMFQDGIMEWMNEMSPAAQTEFTPLIFGNKNKSTDYGYSVNPRRLLSPKRFTLNNNNYLKKLSEDAGFKSDGKYKVDLASVGVWRDAVGPSGKKESNIDIEENVAKGKFGNVTISNIEGFIDTGGHRNMVVDVNIPMKAITNYYNEYLTYDDVPKNLQRRGYVITGGSGADSDGVWKDGYVTVRMLYPMANDEIAKVIHNRSTEKEYGTAGTKELQKFLDDAYLQQFKGFTPDFGFK